MFEQPEELENKVSKELLSVVSSLVIAKTAVQQQAVEAWVMEQKECQHTINLSVSEEKSLKPASIQCADCDLQTNVWLCLHCGCSGVEGKCGTEAEETDICCNTPTNLGIPSV